MRKVLTLGLQDFLETSLDIISCYLAVLSNDIPTIAAALEEKWLY